MHSIYYNILVSVPSFPPSSTHSFESQTIQLNEYFNTPLNYKLYFWMEYLEK